MKIKEKWRLAKAKIDNAREKEEKSMEMLTGAIDDGSKLINRVFDLTMKKLDDNISDRKYKIEENAIDKEITVANEKMTRWFKENLYWSEEISKYSGKVEKYRFLIRTV